MSSVVDVRGDHDLTEVPRIARQAVRLGLLESILVLLFSFADRFLTGPMETAVCAGIVVVGIAAVTVLPGLWTRPRTIEGIAGAAGIGLGAAFVFLLVDVSLLQNIGTYTNRWYAIGGGSNWWYHPVWWMVGTYLPWLGAWIMANQTDRRGEPSVGRLLGTALALTVVCAVLAVVLQVPAAGWNLGTFAIAFLPGLTLATVRSGLGSRRA